MLSACRRLGQMSLRCRDGSWLVRRRYRSHQRRWALSTLKSRTRRGKVWLTSAFGYGEFRLVEAGHGIGGAGVCPAESERCFEKRRGGL